MEYWTKSRSLPDAGVVTLRDVLDQVNRSPCRLHTECRGRKNPRIQRSCIETLDRIVRKTARPVAVMNGHTMYSRKAIIISEVKDHNVEDQWSMGGLDLVFWPEVERYTILPLLELSIELADRIQ